MGQDRKASRRERASCADPTSQPALPSQSRPASTAAPACTAPASHLLLLPRKHTRQAVGQDDGGDSHGANCQLFGGAQQGIDDAGHKGAIQPILCTHRYTNMTGLVQGVVGGTPQQAFWHGHRYTAVQHGIQHGSNDTHAVAAAAAAVPAHPFQQPVGAHLPCGRPASLAYDMPCTDGEAESGGHVRERTRNPSWHDSRHRPA